MAQCRWHCNYKDFPQLLIRWCFHVPAAITRLTRADFLYVNQLVIGLFPPEKISLLHAKAAASTTVTPVSPQSRRAGHMVSLQPEHDTTGFPSLYGRLGPISARRCWLWYSSESWTCFWGIIPPCEQQRDEKSLWATFGNVTHKVCYDLLTQTGLEPEMTQEESSGYSREVLN